MYRIFNVLTNRQCYDDNIIIYDLYTVGWENVANSSRPYLPYLLSLKLTTLSVPFTPAFNGVSSPNCGV